MTETMSGALPRRERKTAPEDDQRNGSKLRKAYRRWLRTTEEGQAEKEAMQDRIEALKETWARKGI